MPITRTRNEQLIEDYFNLELQVHEMFGYKEDWVKIPLADHREYFWILQQDEDGKGGGQVLYAETEEKLEDMGAGNYYSADIYTQRFLRKWVYECNGFTLIAMDPATDGNHYLGVFDNTKRKLNS